MNKGKNFGYIFSDVSEVVLSAHFRIFLFLSPLFFFLNTTLKIRTNLWPDWHPNFNFLNCLFFKFEFSC